MVIAAVIIILVIVGGVMFFRSSPQTNNQTPSVTQENPTSTESTIITEQSSPSGEEETDTGEVKEFTVTGAAFKFDPAEITVNEGDKVRITFENGGGVHDFTLDEFNVKTKTLSTGQEETVEFTAGKAGTYEYYCSVSNHREMGMKGILTVN